MSATTKASAKPADTDQPGLYSQAKTWLKGKLGPHEVRIGQGFVIFSVITLIIALSLASVGGDVHDTAKANGYPDNLCDLALRIRNAGVCFSLVALATGALGIYLWKNAPKQEAEEELPLPESSPQSGNKTKVKAAMVAASIFVTMLVIGLALSSCGGRLYDTSSQLFDLALKIGNWGIGLSLFGLAGAVGSIYLARKWNQEHDGAVKKLNDRLIGGHQNDKTN